jgi:hypothetical protein
MSTKYSKGPWSIKYASDSSGDYGILNAEGKVIAEVFAAINKASERNPEAFWNAQAISTLPELLAAAKEALYRSGKILGDCIEGEGCICWQCGLEKAILAAGDSKA